MVSNLYPPYIHGGAELYVSHISERLSERHDISVITTTPFGRNGSSARGKLGERNGAIYRFYPFNLYSNYHYSRKPGFIKPLWHAFDIWNPHTYTVTKEALKRERPDLVHVHNFKGLSASVFSAAKDLDIPVIHTVHDYNLVCPKTTLLTRANVSCVSARSPCRVYRLFCKRIDPAVVIAPSDFVLNTLSGFGLFADARKLKLPLGIPESEPVMKVNNGTFDILYVGRLGKHKGVHSLIESVKGLDLKNARLHVVGQGSDEARLKRDARDDERIVFYGFLEPDALQQLYSIADVAVVPSVYAETFGLVIPEYYQQGIAVIGSQTGAIPELIEDGYNGLLFPPGDVAALASLLQMLSSDPKLLSELSKNAQMSARAFDLSIHVQKLEEIYEEVASR
jgi:glycosyltransferase involved in cell wall biosynthesis